MLTASGLGMWLTAMARPFVNSTLLNLEMVSLALCFLTFWIGAMLLTDTSSVVGAVGAWVVILCNILGLVGLVGLFGKTKWKEKQLTEWLAKKKVGCCCRACMHGVQKDGEKRVWQGKNPLHGIELDSTRA